MDEEHLKKHLDILWEKVKEQPNDPSRAELTSAFELAQSEIHAETLRSLQQRFEKEKRYWENLVSSKEETIARLEKELQEQVQTAKRLKGKIQELQGEQSGIIQQSFSTLELQKRSLNAHLQKLEGDLEASRKEMLNLKLDLEEEKLRREKLKEEWEEKERHWQEERQTIEIEVENTKKDLFSRRESELEDVARLEESIKKIKKAMSEDQTLHDMEKAGLQNVLNEKSDQIEKMEREIEQTGKKLEKEREDKKLAALEREKLGVQGEEDRKRLVEQLLNREFKIKELEQSLEKIIKERTEREADLREREEKIKSDEETLRQRREDWVNSIKSQASQELSISEKSVDLLGKLESKLGLKPPVIPHDQRLNFPRPPFLQKDSDENLEKIAEKYPVFKEGVRFLRKRESWILVTAGLILFGLSAALLIFESSGRKSVRAQTLLKEGNDRFTRGDLEKSLNLLEKAFELDPGNTIIRNSLTLVLGELANKDFREGKFELALKRVEALYQILPEDPDVIKLHGEIMQAMGKASSGPK